MKYRSKMTGTMLAVLLLALACTLGPTSAQDEGPNYPYPGTLTLHVNAAPGEPPTFDPLANDQGVRAFDIRQARYLGLAKTHLQQVLTATVMNITRALHWLAGDRPTQTRSSAFTKLYAMTA